MGKGWTGLATAVAAMLSAGIASADPVADVLACKSVTLQDCPALQQAAASRKDVLPQLAQRLQDAQTAAAERLQLATALAVLDSRDHNDALEAAAQLLKGQPEQLGVRHAQARLGDMRAAADLRAALQSNDLRQRLLAAGALGMLRDKDARPLLLKALASGQPQRLQAEAARALGGLADPAAEEALLDLVGRPGVYPPARAAALRSLAKQGSRRATAWAVLLADHPLSDTGRAALEVLRAQWQPWARPAVKAALEQPGRRGEAARLASEQKLTELGPRLLELIREGSLEPSERFYVLDALAQLKPQGAPQVLVARLALAQKDERLELLKCLPRLGDRTVVPELVPLLGDADNQVVSHAVYALENLTGQRLGPDVKAWRKYSGLEGKERAETPPPAEGAKPPPPPTRNATPTP